MSNTLPIGTAAGNPDQQVALRADKFNRHTFWCGQSGSGKSYALGVVLEQLLLNTDLPLLIMDPNSDYVRLAETLPHASAAESERLAAADVRVLNSGTRGGERLQTRFLDLDVATKAATLRLDPITDLDEYNVLLHIDERRPESWDRDSYLEMIHHSDDPGERAIGRRVENLQVLEWELWAWGGRSVTDVVDERPSATVLDLGGFTHRGESAVAALSVLEHLWRQREERRPVLIVIDEAHNLCPPNPQTLVERALVDQIVQIAAEGRKFGLWLLLSTQRPTKIHPNVLSQCDNLGLMRMSSPRDLGELADVFGYAPSHLIQESPHFTQGQALFAGGFVSEPTIARMGRRLTVEGGSDVGVPIRA
ncbi:ATP-binding protein [Microlunatus elymi]|uniref:ATP-binding protein n=1 Tax=Microlunatus elymi TaxID=2596828 RepID=A0A516Q370_9ACTN|nr:ATP-binding protein [Microlunatus elymi]QDP97869.1 ATP-binding protein [Microlunatus elymi]